MIAIVGMESKKVYVKGSHADCFRELHATYSIKKGESIYPEPLLVVRI